MSLLAENTKRWNSVKVKPSFMAASRKFASLAMVHKAEYEDIAHEIMVRYGYHIPWWFIPLVHERECRKGVDNWNCNIAQGVNYNLHSHLKPYNGPFPSFKEAAIDALVIEAPQAARNENWSGGGSMSIAERYNGLGYARMGRSSPYVWSGTDKYIRGKYIADGKYDPDEVDNQVGIAVALKALMELDPTIQLDGDHPGQGKVNRKAEGTVVTGASGGLLASINALIPYYDLTWWDIGGFIFGAVIISGLIIYFINKHKKGQI